MEQKFIRLCKHFYLQKPKTLKESLKLIKLENENNLHLTNLKFQKEIF